MTRHTCPDCHLSIPNGQAVIRSVAFKRAVKCRPCAEDAGWIDLPAPRGPHDSELVSRGVDQAEAWANGGAR